MPDLLLASVEYGSYISIAKFVTFLVLFFLWFALTAWVYADAEAVETNEIRWTAIIFSAGVFASFLWLVVPIFAIGLIFYVISIGTVSLAYIVHRNAKVTDTEKVLTINHLKGLLVNEAKKLDAYQNLVFITANRNEVPVPQSKTREFSGFKAAHDIFTDAIWRRTIEIAFIPTPQDYTVIYNVDGVPIKQPNLPREQMEHLLYFIKNLADLDTEEKRKPQKGTFSTTQDDKTIEWQVTTAGSTAGEQLKVTQKKHSDVIRLNDIGLTNEQYEQLNSIKNFKQGLFIVSGTKKSGVTNTFYALLRNHDAFLNSINTLEQHPSVELPNVTQMVYSRDKSYSETLKTMVRMGPDIVGIGECPDTETAQIACKAANKDGKVIYVVLEAQSAAEAVSKWIKLVKDKDLAVDPLIGVSNQRIIRKLCQECKQAYEPDKELLKKFGISTEKKIVLYRPGKVQYDKHGKPRTCDHCQGTGFYERTGVFETILMNDFTKDVIKKAETTAEITKQFRREKMFYLQEQAMRKVLSGSTAVVEVVRLFSNASPKKPENEG